MRQQSSVTHVHRARNISQAAIGLSNHLLAHADGGWSNILPPAIDALANSLDAIKRDMNELMLHSEMCEVTECIDSKKERS